MLVYENTRIGLDGDEAESVSEDLVLYDGSVGLNEDVFDCHGGDLRDQYPPKRIRDRRVYANQVENEKAFVGFVFLYLDA